MTQKFDWNDRRLLKFPAVHPCEGISPATLLESLIKISRNICSYQSKFFATQRRNARESIRQIAILLMFFEEIQDHVPNTSADSIVLCLSELHHTFQKIQFLLEDCTREGARTWMLMKSHFVATQFRTLIGRIATALDVLPLNSIEVSFEVKELVEMLYKQARKAAIELHSRDENVMKRVILVLNQFENKFEPDPFIIRKVLDYLGIKTWAECHKEINFLNGEIRAEYSDSDEREVPLLSSLLGLLSYCRGYLFEDCYFGFFDQTDGRSNNLETLGCLNPEDFLCPISLELMTDPVTVSTGQTYDRASIQKWLKAGNLICPKTGEKLTSTELVSNTSLRNLIQQFCTEYGVSLAGSRKKNRDICRTILPGSPANAEAIKFLSEFLTLRLCYGTDHQKHKAAYEIRLLSKSNLFNRSCLIKSGSVPPLLELLQSTDPGIQENAIAALLKLSSTHEQRKMIGEKTETFPALLELIKHGTPCGKKNSVVAMFALLLYHRNRQRAIASGAVPILLDLLSSSDRVELKTDTLAVLSTLADSTEGSIEILQASAVPLIVRLLQSIETRVGKEYSVSILHSMCLNCGADVLSILATDASLMAALYSLLTDGTSHAIRKARSLTKILHKFCETRSSLAIRELLQDQFVGVR